MCLRWLRRTNMITSRRNWRRCATPSSANYIREEEECQEECREECQEVSLVELEQAHPLALPLRKSTKQSDRLSDYPTSVYSPNEAESKAMNKKQNWNCTSFCTPKHFNKTSNFSDITNAIKHKLKATLSNVPLNYDF